MPYTYFNIEANDGIYNSCVHDIKNFTKDKKIKFPKDIYPNSNLDDLISNVKKIMEYMKLNGKTYLDYFKENEKEQEILWILRTFLLYNILSISTLIFQNPTLIKNLSVMPTTCVSKFYKNLFPDLDSIKGIDKLFKIGNFGSYNKTSDIDLGIQFIGNYKINNTPHMYKIIWLIEGLFINLTGYDTLQFDIELYGDMLTIIKNGVETFYLDTSDLNDLENQELYPAALYSFARNQLMDDFKSTANLDMNMSVIEQKIKEELSKIKKLDKKEQFVFNYLNKSLEYKLWDESKIQESYKNVKSSMKHYLEISYKNGTYVQTYLARKLYYDALKDAELLRINYLNNKNDDKNNRIKLILSIAKSLSYRMEDYTCVPTVTHVVRIIQTNIDITSTNKKRKNPFIYCYKKNHYKNPFCMVGKGGFVLSIIEQIGFIKRFFNKYCNGNNPKCLSKLIKYEFRIAHAIEEINYVSNVNSNKRFEKTSKRHVRNKRTYKKHKKY